MHRDLIIDPRRKRCVIYARISGHRQKTYGDLDRQPRALTLACRQPFKTSPLVLTDIGSGPNMHRGGLKALLHVAKRGSIHLLLITHRDRLARFGVDSHPAVQAILLPHHPHSR